MDFGGNAYFIVVAETNKIIIFLFQSFFLFPFSFQFSVCCPNFMRIFFWQAKNTKFKRSETVYNYLKGEFQFGPPRFIQMSYKLKKIRDFIIIFFLSFWHALNRIQLVQIEMNEPSLGNGMILLIYGSDAKLHTYIYKKKQIITLYVIVSSKDIMCTLI